MVGGEAPTFCKGLRGPRGRPDPKNDRFQILKQFWNLSTKPECSHGFKPEQNRLNSFGAGAWASDIWPNSYTVVGLVSSAEPYPGPLCSILAAPWLG